MWEEYYKCNTHTLKVVYVCVCVHAWRFYMHINKWILRGNVTGIIIKNLFLCVSGGAQRGIVANPTGCITLIDSFMTQPSSVTVITFSPSFLSCFLFFSFSSVSDLWVHRPCLHGSWVKLILQCIFMSGPLSELPFSEFRGGELPLYTHFFMWGEIRLPESH